VIKPALAALGGTAADGTPLLVPGSPAYTQWARALFFVPALAGGLFGLVGGYLTDLLGRRRVLTFSILLYAFAALAAGFATSLPQLLFFRCLVFIGVCVEFVAAVAWLAELFPDREQRERALGWTQAFSSLGGLLDTFREVLGPAAAPEAVAAAPGALACCSAATASSSICSASWRLSVRSM
jgi:MFS family permease